MMRKPVLHLPSPAMAVALTALFVALGGTGYAATELTHLPGATAAVHHRKRPSDSSTDASIAKSQIKKLARGLSVLFAKTAGAATQATNATNATNAGHAASADTATSAGHAASADTATSAGDASTVGHNTILKVAVNVPVPASGSTTTTLFTLDGLTVTHSCMSSGNQDLTASTSAVGELKLVTVNEDTPGAHEFGVDKFDFKPSDGTADLYSGLSDSQNVVGRLIWQTASGQVLTFDYQDETNSFGITNCDLGGMVIAG
jgi:hypothetical protein